MMVEETVESPLSTPTPAPRVAAPSGNCFAIGGYAYAALQMSAVEEAVEEARSKTGLFGGGCLVVGGGGKAEQKAEQKAAEKGGGGKLKAKGKRKESGFRGSQSRFKTTEKMTSARP